MPDEGPHGTDTRGTLPPGEAKESTHGAHRGEAIPGTDDPLFPSAYRLARFCALLSPAILQEELSIGRARAEELLTLLEARGMVGPVFLEQSGARESLINMVNDPAPAREIPLALSNPRSAGRHAVVSSALGMLAALAVAETLLLLGHAQSFVDWIGLTSVFLPAAQVIGLLIAPGAAGLAVGKAVEFLFSPEEVAVPYWSQSVRQAMWTVYAVVALGTGAFVLLR